MTLCAVVRMSVVALMLACASSGVSHALHGYAIVVAETDPQSVELARALREQGVKVRPRVRGGNGPTAALVYFTYQSAVRGEPTWFHLRLADTRSGVIVRASTIQLDSLTATPRTRARAAVRALLAGDAAVSSP
ncbi:MAG TPA: hypothetical protein VF873_02585 [Gemmatimonadales bacterium]